MLPRLTVVIISPYIHASNHYIIHLELIEYCMSTIFQEKKLSPIDELQKAKIQNHKAKIQNHKDRPKSKKNKAFPAVCINHCTKQAVRKKLSSYIDQCVLEHLTYSKPLVQPPLICKAKLCL